MTTRASGLALHPHHDQTVEVISEEMFSLVLTTQNLGQVNSALFDSS
jgi:hypothetical protein